jgi:hypothetical protein
MEKNVLLINVCFFLRAVKSHIQTVTEQEEEDEKRFKRPTTATDIQELHGIGNSFSIVYQKILVLI